VSLACALRWQADWVLVGLYGLFGVLVLGVFVYARPVRLGGGDMHALPGLRLAVLQRLELCEWMADLPLRAMRVGLLLFLGLGLIVPRVVPADFGWLAAALAFALLVGLRWRPEASPWLVRCALYVGSAFVLFLSEPGPTSRAWPLPELLNLLFGGMAVLVILAVRFGRENRFQSTPLDYLMVFLALTIPSLPELRVGETSMNLLIAKLIVLFFAYELLLNAMSTRLKPLAVLSLWLLVGLGVRGIW
jgi:UDP-GlcNAc:undecaprenyl-phosphate GlcNAc-1-phosphate transferase